MAEVVVIGGANMDVKAKSTDVNKLGTSNPGVVNVTAGGVARNIAHNLARLGARVALISMVGDDAAGTALVKSTQHAGVDVSRVGTGGPATGSYVAVLDHDGEMLTAVSDMRAVDFMSPEIISANADCIAAAKFVVADCNLPIATLQTLGKMVGNRLIVEPVSVPKSRKLKALLQTAPVFLATPNLDQVDAMFGSRNIDEATAHFHRLGLQSVVIHAGAEGAFFSSAGQEGHVPPQSAGPIVDVTGAGDAAVAGLVFGLLQDYPLVEAAALGQKLAGRVIASLESTLA